MESQENNRPVQAELMGRSAAISNEVKILQNELAETEATAGSFVNEAILDRSQKNNEASQDLLETDERIASEIKALNAELVMEKAQAKLHYDTGSAAAAHLVGLEFDLTTTSDDVDLATEHLTDEEAAEKANLPYGPRLYVGGWNASQIALMVACACMSGTAFAILFHALDPTDILAQPFGIGVAAVAGTVVAMSANKLMRAWIEFGSLVAKRDTTNEKAIGLAAMTGGIAIGLALADANCIIRINEVRARLDPSLSISPFAAFGIGATLSALYVLASAQTYKAKGYNDAARFIVEGVKAAFDKVQREDPVFWIYSKTVKESLSGYKRALTRIGILERKIEEAHANRQTKREQFRAKRKQPCTDRRSEDVQKIELVKLKLRDAENRLAHVQALLTNSEEVDGRLNS